MAAPQHVFISSTAKDLAPFRTAAIAKIERLDGWKCVNMERFGARAGPTVEVDKKLVQQCKLFVGLLGHLYGNCPKGSTTSYTEHEYEAAVTANIPRLMFVAEEGVAVSPELLRADSDPERQVAFRKRVMNSGEIAGRFDNPKDLAADIVIAIGNEEKWQAPVPPDAPRRGRGEIVSKLCNRVSQEMQFWKNFRLALKMTPGLPQIYVIRGDEREAPGSLVARFRFKNIQEYANKTWPADGVVSYRLVPWPSTDEENIRQARLTELLFDKWEAGDAPTTSEEKAGVLFARQIAARRDKIMVVKHDIRAADWDARTLNCLKWYFGFWDDAGRELAGSASPPQCVIFLNIIYPYEKPKSGWLARLWGAGEFDPSGLEKDLLSILNARQTRVSDTGEKLSPACLLDALHCVRREDVMTWFAANQILEDEPLEQRTEAEKIFEKRDCRHMDELESELQRILEKATT